MSTGKSETNSSATSAPSSWARLFKKPQKTIADQTGAKDRVVDARIGSCRSGGPGGVSGGDNERKIYCHNCGALGHISKTCPVPITSYGIVLFHPVRKTSAIEENPLLIPYQDALLEATSSLASKNPRFLKGTLTGSAVGAANGANDIEPAIPEAHAKGKRLAQSPDFSHGETTREGMDEHHEGEDDDRKPTINYLLIMDRHTPDFAQIIIGNYDLEDLDYLRTLIGRLTQTEAQLILTYDLKYLFTHYWTFSKKDALRMYQKQFYRSEQLFNRLKKGIRDPRSRGSHYHRRHYRRPSKGSGPGGPLAEHDAASVGNAESAGISGGRSSSPDDRAINNHEVGGQDSISDRGLITWKSLIEETEPHWMDPDWGFPKGRRKRHGVESDLECAKREVFEETGISEEQYHILEDLEPIEEIMHGSNGIQYRAIYFIAEAKNYIPLYSNPFNRGQQSEVGKIGWYTYEQARKLIRPYQESRLHFLHRVHKYLGNLYWD